jgi:hypothetical protein
MSAGEGTGGYTGPERRVDLQTRKRIESIAKGYVAFTARTTWYLRAMVLLFALSAGAFTWLLNKNSDRARETRALVHQINAERARNVRDGCVGQNQRHDGTVLTVDKLLLQAVAIQEREKVSDATRRKLDELAKAGRAARSDRVAQGLLLQARKLVSPVLRQQIDQSRGQTVLLVDSLAPRRDCVALVRSQVGRPPRTP